MQVQLKMTPEEQFNEIKERTQSALKAVPNFTRQHVITLLQQNGMGRNRAHVTSERMLRSWRQHGLVIYQGHKQGWKFL